MNSYSLRTGLLTATFHLMEEEVLGSGIGVTANYLAEHNDVKKHNNYDFEIEQDENFSLIAGYTSGGFPYGNPWEE